MFCLQYLEKTVKKSLRKELHMKGFHFELNMERVGKARKILGFLECYEKHMVWISDKFPQLSPECTKSFFQQFHLPFSVFHRKYCFILQTHQSALYRKFYEIPSLSSLKKFVPKGCFVHQHTSYINIGNGWRCACARVVC